MEISANEAHWFFLFVFGTALVVFAPVYGYIINSDLKKYVLCRFIILPTFYVLVVLFCIGFIGMVVNTTIQIISG